MSMEIYPRSWKFELKTGSAGRPDQRRRNMAALEGDGIEIGRSETISEPRRWEESEGGIGEARQVDEER